jgi:coenzyme F420-reducing hydrogenase delta subunit
VTAQAWRFAPNVGKIAMAEPIHPDIVVYVCRNCMPEVGGMPRQWNQDGAHVLVREVPCSGKIDAQYLFHALEAGGHGLCVVACSRGKCSLGEGNYRAEVRVRTVRRLLAEIGLEPERVELLHCASDDHLGEGVEELARGAVQRLCALGESRLGRAAALAGSSA